MKTKVTVTYQVRSTFELEGALVRVNGVSELSESQLDTLERKLDPIAEDENYEIVALEEYEEEGDDRARWERDADENRV